jgi:hypothetical protein
MWEISCPAEDLLASQEGLSFKELDIAAVVIVSETSRQNI